MMRDIDTEALIDEVKRRPPLFDKSETDPIKRKKYWYEVGATVFLDWNEFSQQEKHDAYRDLQRRWANLRTSFHKELRERKKGKDRKRSYKFFQQMAFLLPSIQSAEPEPCQTEEEVIIEDTGIEPCTIDPDPDKLVYFTTNTNKPITTPSKPSKETVQKVTECDEDVNFVMSLVPMLRRLSNHEKLDMKLKILTLFKTNTPRAAIPPKVIVKHTPIHRPKMYLTIPGQPKVVFNPVPTPATKKVKLITSKVVQVAGLSSVNKQSGDSLPIITIDENVKNINEGTVDN